MTSAAAVPIEGTVHGHSRRREIPALTSLRAFAALHVVLFHTILELGGPKMAKLPLVVKTFLACGQSAVSFFFVLSGFILAYTYSNADGTLQSSRKNFWRARFARIYPLYFLSFLLDAPRAIGYFVRSSSALSVGLAKAGVAAAGFVFLLQSWWPRITNSWNTPGWSLSTEAFFYLAFPFLLSAMARRRLGGMSMLVLALVAWSLPVLAYALLELGGTALQASATFQTFWRSFPPLRLPEFLLGVAIGRLFQFRSFVSRSILPGLGVAACVGIIVLMTRELGIPHELIGGSLLAPLVAIVIAALAANRLPGAHWLELAPLPLLGRASYAVYILHQPVKTWFVKLADLLGARPSPVLLVTYLVALQVICIAMLIYVEDPLRRRLTSRRTSV